MGMAQTPAASSHLLEDSCLSFKSPVNIALGSILCPYFSHDAELNPQITAAEHPCGLLLACADLTGPGGSPG